MLHDLIVVLCWTGLLYLLLRTFAGVSPATYGKFLAKVGLVPTPPTP